MTSDTYDTTRAGLVIVGLVWAVPGLALAAGGLLLILRRGLAKAGSPRPQAEDRCGGRIVACASSGMTSARNARWGDAPSDRRRCVWARRATSLSHPWPGVSSARSSGSETDHGTFAVKQELGSGPVDEAGTSAAYHRVLGGRHPDSEPLRAMTGGYTAQVDGERVRAYAWAELPLDPTLDPAAVGTLVARLHQVRHPWPTSRSTPGSRRRLAGGVEGRSQGLARPGAPYAARLAELFSPCSRSRRSSPNGQQLPPGPLGRQPAPQRRSAVRDRLRQRRPRHLRRSRW